MTTIAAGILTYNRSEAVTKAIDSVLSQKLSGVEVIVVDNNSADNTEEMIRAKFPEVTYIKNDENLGCPSGRNVVYRNCNSDYIVNLDDDGYLERGTIKKIKEAFDADPSVGVVAFHQCYTDEKDKARPFTAHNQEAVHFLEGVCAFRMKMLDEVGLYPEDFFQYHEGFDLGIRILDSDWKIISRADIVMWHPRIGGGGGNQDGRWDYYKFKNYLSVVIKYFPFPQNCYYFSRKSVLYMFYALRHKSLGKYFRALAKVCSDLPSTKGHKKVRKNTVRRYYREKKRAEKGIV